MWQTPNAAANREQWITQMPFDRLSHELGVVLELSNEPAEMRTIWSEALDALADAKAHLVANGLGIPPVAENVLQVSERAG